MPSGRSAPQPSAVPESMREAVIVSAVRSPFGKAHRGSLTSLRPDDLSHQVVGAALARVPGVAEMSIDDLIVGCAVPSGEHGDNIARRIAVLMGRDDVSGLTVNRFCASSLESARIAANAIRSGEATAIVSAGVDCVSRYAQADDSARHPAFDAAQQRSETRTAASMSWTDPRAEGGLPDIHMSMGQTAENVAQIAGVSREEQDAWALLSQHRAGQAQASGFLGRLIAPIRTPEGAIVDTDDCIRPASTADGLAGLVPVFREGGSVTAGNSCPVNDGASAVVVMDRTRAEALGVTPLALIRGTATSALSPEIMGLGPVEATHRLLERHGMTIGDVDLIEINEAFAAQVVACQRALQIDADRLNVHGGAIAIGHPYGATGGRLLATLIESLRESDGHLGVATMCVAGGQGVSMLVERLS